MSQSFRWTPVRFRSNGTPVPVDIRRSAPVFVKHRIGTIRYKPFGMFAERSTCYFCLSSVCMRSLLSPFQSVHSSRLVPSAAQDGLSRLYIKKRILVYYRCKKNCMEIARCLTEKEKGFYTFVTVQRGNAAAMMGTMGGTTPSVDFFS